MKKFVYLLSFAALVFLGWGASPIAHAEDGYNLGYEEAEENGVTDLDYDESDSESFNEGVGDYSEEMQGEND